MILLWNGHELQQTSERSWSSNTDAPFICSVVTSNDRDYVATITFANVRWSQSSVHPQSAIDGAARKAGRWLKEFSSTAKWLTAICDAPKPVGAKRGVYSMAKVPDSPEQEAWIRRKRAGKH